MDGGGDEVTSRNMASKSQISPLPLEPLKSPHWLAKMFYPQRETTDRSSNQN